MTTTTASKTSATANDVTIEKYEATSADWTTVYHVRAFRGDSGLAANNFAWATHKDGEVARAAANRAYRMAQAGCSNDIIRHAVFAR